MNPEQRRGEVGYLEWLLSQPAVVPPHEVPPIPGGSEPVVINGRECCPVCAAPVQRDQIDVTTAAQFARGERASIPGVWQCPYGCDPRTGRPGPPRI